MLEAIAGAAISGGLSFLSGSKQAGAVEAAGAQSAQALLESTEMQIDEIRRQYDIGRADMAPWRQYGRGALEILGEGFGLYPTEGASQPVSGSPVQAAAAPVTTTPGQPPQYNLDAIRSLLLNDPYVREMDAYPERNGPNAASRYVYGLSDDELIAAAAQRGITPERYPAVAAAAQEAAPTTAAPEQTYGVERRGGGEFMEPIIFDPSGVRGMAMLEMDPGYEFRLAEGEKAIQRMAAAGGHAVSDGRGIASGRTGKALLRYGQDYASNEYGRAYGRAYGKLTDIYRSRVADRDARYNKLAALAGAGQTAATNTASLGAGAAGQIAGAYGAQGANLAQVYQGQGTNLANIYGGMAQNLNNSVQGFMANRAAERARTDQNALLQAFIGGGGVTGSSIPMPSYAPNVFN